MSIKVLKKVFFFGILLFLLIILGIVSYRFDNYATFSWEARFRWGHLRFDSKKFQEVPTNEKANMISDLMRQRYCIGKSTIKVIEALGERTGGYYNSDIHLTYRIYEKGKTAWDLVLIVDHKTHRIQKVFAYRQQGGITRTILYGFMKLIIEEGRVLGLFG